MIIVGRSLLAQGRSHFDYLKILQDRRQGVFEGSIQLLEAKGGSYVHPLIGKTWPLCWGTHTGKLAMIRNQTTQVLLAEYYQDTIQDPEWKVSGIGWDPIGLLPVHMVDDPTATFKVRVRIWRSSWVSDIVAWVLFDETVTITSPVELGLRSR